VTVRPASGISVTTLNKYPLKNDADGRVSLQLGDLAARQEVSLVFRLQFPAGADKETLAALFSLSDATGVLSAPDTDIVWTFADHAANDAQRRNTAVDRAVAELYGAAARADALEMNRAGRFDQAALRLEATAKRIEQYAGSDPDLRRLIAELRERHDAYSAPMSPMAMKGEYFASRNISSMRDPAGKARRRPNRR